ncbi:adenine phosphoribosyltransferase 1 [Xylona heveae TC161]|uniref:adenine phosphoribosyltransferase n=1 Tax=Xylona heveae (strain CBS 132557 / TC161) TaxID=1328760 RepID=A0A165I719_XYLHT|nr:adenine phosphoribosyltransferase 1 [Xylona heveae TC161]KZF24483.1 adenine phosphoribosyltransferase 1 [Xylona heveae TC161]
MSDPSISAQRSYGVESTSSHPPRDQPDPTVTGNASTGLAASSPAGTAELSGLKIRLRKALRQFPDFPSPGILFEDILPIFADPHLHAGLLRAIEIHILNTFGGEKPDVIVGLDARGFLFGPSLALRLDAAFVPVRKRGKLPGPTEVAAYQKEYGQDFFEMQKGVIKPGSKVVIVDDLIATGGSAAAAGALVEKQGGKLLEYIFIMELEFLKGREKLNAPVYSLLTGQS